MTKWSSSIWGKTTTCACTSIRVPSTQHVVFHVCVRGMLVCMRLCCVSMFCVSVRVRVYMICAFFGCLSACVLGVRTCVCLIAPLHVRRRFGLESKDGVAAKHLNGREGGPDGTYHFMHMQEPPEVDENLRDGITIIEVSDPPPKKTRTARPPKVDGNLRYEITTTHHGGEQPPPQKKTPHGLPRWTQTSEMESPPSR